MTLFRMLAAVFTASLVCNSRAAAQESEYQITIQNHTFSPTELTVPAGVKFKLTIINRDPTPEEFESYDLNRERVVNGTSTLTLYIGPLDSGRYEYFGEFNPQTARGILVAK